MAVNVPSAALIDVTSGTETLATVYTAVAGSSYPGNMARTGSEGSYVYTIINGCALEVSNGGTLNMSDGDTLEWDLAASLAPALRIQDGGVFTATTNCTITLDKNDANDGDIWIYGQFNAQGTSGNEVIIEKMDEISFYTYSGNDPCDWDYVIVKDPVPVTAGANMIYLMYSLNYGGLAHTFNNITISSTNDRGRGIVLGGDRSNITFDNITMDNVYTAVHGYSASLFKFANSIFKNTYSYPFTFVAMSGNLPITSSQDNACPEGRDFLQQPKITFDTCTFDNNYTYGTTYAYRYFYRATVKFKDCTFQNCSHGLRMENGANILLQGSITNTCTDTKYWPANNRGKLFHVFALNLTVQDYSGNPIEDARVIVTQSEDLEKYAFITNSSGQIKDLYNDDPVFIEKEEYNDSTYTQRSDSIAGGRYHTIKISKDNYQIWSKDITFTEDRTVVAALQPLVSGKLLPQG